MKQGQRRSPWLLILRLHSCVVFVCACIRHYFPRRQGNHLNRGWLHRVMGVSPPAGSLSAALLAWSPFRWGLGLDGSIIVPDGVVAIQLAIGCFVDGRIRLAPYLAVVDRCFCSRAFELFFSKHFLRVDPQHLQVVLAHPPKSLAPGQGAPAGKYSDNRIFSFQGARGGR